MPNLSVFFQKPHFTRAPFSWDNRHGCRIKSHKAGLVDESAPAFICRIPAPRGVWGGSWYHHFLAQKIQKKTQSCLSRGWKRRLGEAPQGNIQPARLEIDKPEIVHVLTLSSRKFQGLS